MSDELDLDAAVKAAQARREAEAEAARKAAEEEAERTRKAEEERQQALRTELFTLLGDLGLSVKESDLPLDDQVGRLRAVLRVWNGETTSASSPSDDDQRELAELRQVLAGMQSELEAEQAKTRTETGRVRAEHDKVEAANAEITQLRGEVSSLRANVIADEDRKVLDEVKRGERPHLSVQEHELFDAFKDGTIVQTDQGYWRDVRVAQPAQPVPPVEPDHDDPPLPAGQWSRPGDENYGPTTTVGAPVPPTADTPSGGRTVPPALPPRPSRTSAKDKDDKPAKKNWFDRQAEKLAAKKDDAPKRAR